MPSRLEEAHLNVSHIASSLRQNVVFQLAPYTTEYGSSFSNNLKDTAIWENPPPATLIDSHEGKLRDPDPTLMDIRNLPISTLIHIHVGRLLNSDPPGNPTPLKNYKRRHHGYIYIYEGSGPPSAGPGYPHRYICTHEPSLIVF